MISARPELIRSTVAKSWETRTGSRTLSTVIALVSRIVLVRAAIAASTTAGDDTAKSWLWCSPSANTSNPSRSPRTAYSTVCEMRCAAVTFRPVSRLVCRSLSDKMPSSTGVSMLVKMEPNLHLPAGAYVRPARTAADVPRPAALHADPALTTRQVREDRPELKGGEQAKNVSRLL